MERQNEKLHVHKTGKELLMDKERHIDLRGGSRGGDTAIQVAFCFSTMNTTNIYCLFYFMLWTDPGFQVRGGVLKTIAPSGGRRENIWGISCEK
jgi:hypothetical protein